MQHSNATAGGHRLQHGTTGTALHACTSPYAGWEERSYLVSTRAGPVLLTRPVQRLLMCLGGAGHAWLVVDCCHLAVLQMCWACQHLPRAQLLYVAAQEKRKKQQ